MLNNWIYLCCLRKFVKLLLEFLVFEEGREI